MKANGTHIRAIRERAGVDRVQLADVAGITPKSLTNVETGYAGASRVVLHRIANFLHVDIAEITVPEPQQSAA